MRLEAFPFTAAMNLLTIYGLGICAIVLPCSSQLLTKFCGTGSVKVAVVSYCDMKHVDGAPSVLEFQFLSSLPVPVFAATSYVTASSLSFTNSLMSIGNWILLFL